MKKIYHVVASRCGALGASCVASRVSVGHSTKRAADAACARFRGNPEPRTVYFVEWDYTA